MNGSFVPRIFHCNIQTMYCTDRAVVFLLIALSCQWHLHHRGVWLMLMAMTWQRCQGWTQSYKAMRPVRIHERLAVATRLLCIWKVGPSRVRWLWTAKERGRQMVSTICRYCLVHWPPNRRMISQRRKSMVYFLPSPVVDVSKWKSTIDELWYISLTTTASSAPSAVSSSDGSSNACGRRETTRYSWVPLPSPQLTCPADWLG